MPARSDALETIVMALELLKRIPRQRKVTAPELHRQLKEAGLDRDLRTIQRQLEFLSAHFEIERDISSKPYGYRWLEQARGLSVPNLTPHESLLLRLAEEHLRNFLPPRLMKSMDGFFSQARRNLGPESSARLEREWPHKIRVVATSMPLLPPSIAPGVMEAVSEALFSNRWLHVEYRNAAGKQADRDVMPLGLVQQGPRMYLVCRFHGYENERNLALHRIRAAQVSTLGFVRPRGFDLKHYDDEGRFAFGDGSKVRLRFHMHRDEAKHLAETPLSTDQTLNELSDGAVEVTATVVDSLLLRRWLAGFGDALWHLHVDPVNPEKSDTGSH